MGLTIMAGGCRTVDHNGKVEERQCNTCFSQTTCDLEPRARELSALFASQWVKREDVLPSQASPVLYLTYSPESPSGSLHLGHYDGARQCFIEQTSGVLIDQQQVFAWMAIPKVPAEIQDSWNYSVKASGCFNTTPWNSEPEAPL